MFSCLMHSTNKNRKCRLVFIRKCFSVNTFYWLTFHQFHLFFLFIKMYIIYWKTMWKYLLSKWIKWNYLTVFVSRLHSYLVILSLKKRRKYTSLHPQEDAFFSKSFFSIKKTNYLSCSVTIMSWNYSLLPNLWENHSQRKCI